MASGCENVTARCEVICSPFWNILMLRRITMAAKGNCDPPQRTAKSRAASDPVGVPIYSPPFDPSLAPQHDGESMHIKLFALFYTGNRCYCRVEQILALEVVQIDRPVVHPVGPVFGQADLVDHAVLGFGDLVELALFA